MRGIRGVKVVYSKELPQKPAESQETGKRQIPGSLSFVPPVAGMILAGEVIRHIARRGFGIRKGIDSTFISVTIVIIK